MGNTATVEVSSGAEITTVNTATDHPSAAQNTLLSRLEQMPQLQRAAHSKAGEDQVWRDLANYSQEQLQMDPQVVLQMLNVYKAWNRTQADTVAQRQDFVNKRISDIDKLVTEVLEEASRRQQMLNGIPAMVETLTKLQTQLELLAERLVTCTAAIQSAGKVAHTKCKDLATPAES